MTSEAPGKRVLMIHDDVAAAPVFPVSPDYRVRWYRPGDAKIWTDIQRAADRYNEITDDLFSRQFPGETLDLVERQCYLIDAAGAAIGTATAWEETREPYCGYGLVHWVAVLPECQHRGIGKMLMSLVCRRMAELGYQRACLRTSTVRQDAIALYRRFGFRIETDTEQA